jgi:hypothetical protein
VRPITYVQVLEPELQFRVRRRFAADIAALAGLGFSDVCFYSEQMGPYSVFRQFVLFAVMLVKREVLHLCGPWQAGAAFIIMYHRDPATMAVPMGMGVKFYTGFTDQTLLISSNFNSAASPNPESKVVRHSSRLTVDEAWKEHCRLVSEMKSGGKRIETTSGFDRYVEMSRLEETALEGMFACAYRTQP